MSERIADLGERGLIRRLRESIPALSEIGDDSAALPSLACPVVTTDSFFEGTHFHRWWAPAPVLGRRLLEATLSDLAAMGAKAGWIFPAVSLDPDMDVDWLEGFYHGLTRRREVRVAGGETVRGSRFGITLTAIGEGGDPNTLLRRSSLKPGDILWTSGPVGRALGAPEMLERAGGMRDDPLEPVKDGFTREETDQLRAFLLPVAELDTGHRLREMGVRCAIDISDGLLSEAQHLCRESGVDIVLELNETLFFPSVSDRPAEAAAAGEDFVLLCGASPELDLSALGCYMAGRAAEGRGELTVFLHGKEMDVRSVGYDHMEVD